MCDICQLLGGHYGFDRQTRSPCPPPRENKRNLTDQGSRVHTPSQPDTFSLQVSNFDERLHPLLKNLGVYDCFDFVLTSRECGSEKPDPYMFREALTRAGAQEASGVGVHVGDRFSKDVLGARGAGWAPVLITGRRDPSEEEERVEHIRVVKLTDVPAALGVKRR